MTVVYVAIYGHEYGEDVRVFDDITKARAWRDKIAEEWWDHEFPDESRPAEDIGEAYFDKHGDFLDKEEWFHIEEAIVE